MKTILLIEDEASTRTFIKGLLERAGYHVITDEDGHRALEMVTKHSPDLLLTDLNLPEVGGLSIISDLSERTERPPIIAMSAGDAYGRDYLELSKEFGADAILHKPIEPSKLLALVAQLLPA